MSIASRSSQSPFRVAFENLSYSEIDLKAEKNRNVEGRIPGSNDDNDGLIKKLIAKKDSQGL